VLTPFSVEGIYDAPGFNLRLIDTNDLGNLVNHVDFGQTSVNLGDHLENLANNP
jgi:hypothetical protein